MLFSVKNSLSAFVALLRILRMGCIRISISCLVVVCYFERAFLNNQMAIMSARRLGSQKRISARLLVLSFIFPAKMWNRK